MARKLTLKFSIGEMVYGLRINTGNTSGITVYKGTVVKYEIDDIDVKVTVLDTYNVTLLEELCFSTKEELFEHLQSMI